MKNLDDISELHSDTKVLNLSNNYLSVIRANDFNSLPALVELRLDLNQISSINGTAFHGLSSLKILNLSYNSLSVFPRGAAVSLTNLTHLFLSNNSLRTLCGQGFLHSLTLKELDISLNQLDCGNMSCLAKLTSLNILWARNINTKCPESPLSLTLNLSQLDLSDNKLTNFSFSASGGLISISVDLSGNLFSSPEALANLSPRSLDLRNNPINVTQLLLDLSWAPKLQSITISLKFTSSTSIRSICVALASRHTRSLKLTDIRISGTHGHFQNCSSLYHLDVSWNKFMTATLFSCQKPLWSLRSLQMDHNHIVSLNFCTGKGSVSLPNLTSLSLRSNRIYRVPAEAFNGMPKLWFLSLAGNRIAYIEKMAFLGLGQLNELVLSENAISVLYNSTFQNLSKLTVLKLRNNRLKRLFAHVLSLPTLIKLDLGSNAIEVIQDGSFKGMPNLTDLYLDRNNLQKVTREMFPDLRRLQVLDLASNDLKFSPREVPPFGNLAMLRSLKLQRQQPHGIRSLPSDLFTGLGQLRELYLSNNKLYDLDNLPLSKLTNLTRLEMSDMCNGVARMPNTTFPSLSRLNTLILENFGLNEIEAESFKIPTLYDLVLTNNMLQTIPADFGEFLPRLHHLDIRFNPLACICANEGFRLWALQSRVHVILFYQIKCPSTSVMENKTQLLADGQSEVCRDPTERLAFSISITVVLALLVGGLGYGKGKWYLMYAYYMLRIWLKEIQLHKARPKKYRYDAFVSYSSQDEEWVFTELVPHLERAGDAGGGPGARGCQLCLHHRDFEPGKTIVSNIVEAIYSSRKTLCLVSPRYFNSEWCSMEVQVALYRLFDEKNDLLVLVFLEPPPPWALTSFHRLHRVMRRRTYLEWPREAGEQHVFWARLRLALQLPEREDPEDPGLI
ncbi:hypothetical protein SKAU_G00299990 [Synaphobranchus kaupii]|uniref:TIR domain-containing protein n=1 Tax=Synaphobranchus kaupii TaxID=118154 RepID=A0A9Q1IN75_SYNKA|nr:hypothetical protein SKAU_G00299990 [Synaphobranchus kaupii]